MSEPLSQAVLNLKAALDLNRRCGFGQPLLLIQAHDLRQILDRLEDLENSEPITLNVPNEKSEPSYRSRTGE